MRALRRMRIRPIHVVGTVLAVVALSACTETAGPTSTVGSVVLAPSDSTLVVGDTLRLIAGILDSAGELLNDRKISWSSSDLSIATVSSGLVTGIGGGAVTLVAAAEGSADSATLIVVPAFSAVQVVSGQYSTCAVAITQQAYCWGDNYRGSLGNGLPDAVFVRPSMVAGDLRWSSVDVALLLACGVTTGGVPYCWGSNSRGQLGAATPAFSSTPLQLPASAAVRTVATGEEFSCVLETGGVECWGFSGAVSPQFTAVSAGADHLCGLTIAGMAYCWGGNWTGQLGDGTTVGRSVPTPVAGGRVFAAIDGGQYSTCALDGSDAAWCWGWNSTGRLGDGTTIDRHAPVAVVGGIKFRMISVGYSHTCGVSLAGAAFCWGANDHGQLGDGSLDWATTPVPVVGGVKFASVSAGDSHTCGVSQSGVVFCWGNNETGQLGDNTRLDRQRPVRVWGP